MQSKESNKYFTKAVADLGQATLDMFQQWGSAFYLSGRILASLRFAGKNRRLIVQQMTAMGVNSLPLVLFSAVFTGMVAAVQAAYQMQGLVPPIWLGAGIARAVMIELGPVLTALVVAGRVGAGIAAELGTCGSHEQMNAAGDHGHRPGVVPGDAAVRGRGGDGPGAEYSPTSCPVGRLAGVVASVGISRRSTWTGCGSIHTRT